MGALPNVYPGYQRVDDSDIKQKFETAWGYPLSGSPGLTLTEMFDAACEGKVQSVYLIGENPVLSDPDAKHVSEALEKLDFLVVQDIFLTETAQFADVVLPAYRDVVRYRVLRMSCPNFGQGPTSHPDDEEKRA